MSDCPVCGAVGSQPVWAEGAFVARRCDHCSVVHVTPGADGGRGEIFSEDYYRKNYIAFEDVRLDYAQKLVARVLDLLRSSSRTRRVLEVGCGPGYYLRAFQAAGWDVVGVEPAPFARRYAHDRFGIEVYAALEEVPRDELGLVTFFDVLAHVPEPFSLLRSAVGRLAADGSVAVKTPCHSAAMFAALRLVSKVTETRGLLHVPSQICHFDAGSLRNLIRAVGFEEVKCAAIRELFLPVRWRDNAQVALYTRGLKWSGLFGMLPSMLAIGRTRT